MTIDPTPVEKQVMLHGMIFAGDRLVSADHERIAAIIKEYDPDLSLQWIPPNLREPGDKAFRVVHTSAGKEPYVVGVWDNCTPQILEDIFRSDLTRNPDIMARIEASEAAALAIRKKEEEDARELTRDFVESVVRSPKSRYRHNGVTFE
jgi:hypothetical protein